MRLHFRHDRHTPTHDTFAVFVNGAHAGEVTMRVEEAHELYEAAAPDVVRGHNRLVIEVDPIP